MACGWLAGKWWYLKNGCYRKTVNNSPWRLPAAESPLFVIRISFWITIACGRKLYSLSSTPQAVCVQHSYSSPGLFQIRPWAFDRVLPLCKGKSWDFLSYCAWLPGRNNRPCDDHSHLWRLRQVPPASSRHSRWRPFPHRQRWQGRPGIIPFRYDPWQKQEEFLSFPGLTGESRHRGLASNWIPPRSAGNDAREDSWSIKLSFSIYWPEGPYHSFWTLPKFSTLYVQS